MKVKILRGLPGSGKSTYCRKFPKAVICSADYYHIIDGQYEFHQENIAAAHQECLREFIEACQFSQERDYIYERIIIVDNTNTTTFEIIPYLKIAEVYNCEIEIVEFDCTVEQSNQRNIHNVSFQTICNMYNNLQQPLPKQWQKYIKKGSQNES